MEYNDALLILAGRVINGISNRRLEVAGIPTTYDLMSQVDKYLVNKYGSQSHLLLQEATEAIYNHHLEGVSPDDLPK